MVGILVVTHGAFAEGIVNAMELICGPQKNLKTMSLVIQDDVEVFAEAVRHQASTMEEGEGVLIFVDFMSGSPANVVARFLLTEEHMEGIAGVNFPMLLEAVNSRDTMGVKELAETCRTLGTAGIVDMKARLKELMEDD